MLTHIVVWKYKPEADAEARREHVARLRALAPLIPEIQSLAVGSDVLHLERSYDTGLVAVFRDRAGLDAYTNHPEHLAVVEIGKRISASVVSVDFVDEENGE